MLAANTLLTSGTTAQGMLSPSRLNRGDVAILSFLAAAEIIEADLWQQYNELALGNKPFQDALTMLDGDMPTYVNQNTRDEVSHANFINAYLVYKRNRPISLERFRTLPSSQADGANKTARRLTNLLDLTVDTSWYNRYRFPGNPDQGDSFDQIVDLVNLPGIPANNSISGDQMQLTANTAGFHFVTIEQGGSSLYDSFVTKVTNLEVLRIVTSIGGTEIQHFELWQDKAGNAPPVPLDTGTLFPQLPKAPAQTATGIDVASPQHTNQVMPAPCEFINPRLPLCSVIRPTSTVNAGAAAAVTGLTRSGLFNGQSQEFFQYLRHLAFEADRAKREF